MKLLLQYALMLWGVSSAFLLVWNYVVTLPAIAASGLFIKEKSQADELLTKITTRILKCSGLLILVVTISSLERAFLDKNGEAGLAVAIISIILGLLVIMAITDGSSYEILNEAERLLANGDYNGYASMLREVKFNGWLFPSFSIAYLLLSFSLPMDMSMAWGRCFVESFLWIIDIPYIGWLLGLVIGLFALSMAIHTILVLVFRARRVVGTCLGRSEPHLTHR